MASSAGSDRSSSTMTHYQILGVRPDSSPADIKSAFISLSKSYHPDTDPNDPTKHEAFVKIIQAYAVLKSPGLRSSYDSRLARSKSSNSPYIFDPSSPSQNTDWTVESDAPRWRDETMWEMRDRSEDKFYEGRPYYGIKGIKRVNNLWIAALAIMVMGVGSAFHLVTLRKTSAFATARLDEKDLRLGKHLKTARQLAERNGNDLQLEILEARMARKDED